VVERFDVWRWVVVEVVLFTTHHHPQPHEAIAEYCVMEGGMNSIAWGCGVVVEFGLMVDVDDDRVSGRRWRNRWRVVIVY
jgi:hypothetical protein